MRQHRFPFLLAVGLAVAFTTARGASQTALSTPDAHISAARVAAGQEHLGLFNALCLEQIPAAPKDWHVEPVKVFDNLYFVGQRGYSAWAVTTSEGIIVIDTIFDYSVEDEIVGGLRKLGFDPATIKYAIVSHGHFDHSGGARLLQERFGTRIILSEADWDLLDKSTRPKPKRDMVATDGQQLTLGDTTLTMYLTPGHTPGSISTLVPIKDKGRAHVAAAWGGTGYNFTITPDKPAAYWFETYLTSVGRFKPIAAAAGADIVLANHWHFDNSDTKLPAMASLQPGQPNPWIIGRDSVQRYLTVTEECAKAGQARLKK